MKKVVAPYLRIGFSENQLYLGFGSIKHVVSDPVLQKACLKCYKEWQSPYTIEEMIEVLSHNYNKEVVNQVIEISLKNNYLIDIMTHMIVKVFLVVNFYITIYQAVIQK